MESRIAWGVVLAALLGAWPFESGPVESAVAQAPALQLAPETAGQLQGGQFQGGQPPLGAGLQPALGAAALDGADAALQATPALQTPGQPATLQTPVLQTPGPQTQPAARALGGAAAPSAAPTTRVTKVHKGNGTLPNEHGQVWREYDISPYTSRVATTAKPEQAVIDWILRETGTDVWFSEPFGVLSAGRDTLKVYHTPEMQELVHELVDRFVHGQGEVHVLGLHLLTVGNPNWRATAVSMMRPVNVQTPGLEAWVMSKENAAVLLGQLRKRSDFKEHAATNLPIHNGQSHTLAQTRPRTFVRSVRMRQTAWAGHELEMGRVEEGFAMQLSPLLSIDRAALDVVIRCNVDQVEKLVPVQIEIPSPLGQVQNVPVQVPQMVSWRIHERFRWPTDQMLVVSCGVVATPAPEKARLLPIPTGLPDALNPPAPSFLSGPSRADALMFLESKGKADQALVELPSAIPAGLNNRGRY